MRTAETSPALRFHPMPDDLASAVFALGRQRVDGAFEAVKGVLLPRHDNLERLVIFISADFAVGHDRLLSAETCALSANLTHRPAPAVRCDFRALGCKSDTLRWPRFACRFPR